MLRMFFAAAAALLVTSAMLAATMPQQAHAAYRCLKKLGKDGNYVICPQGNGTYKITKLPSRIPNR
jgi:hypothetical protein